MSASRIEPAVYGLLKDGVARFAQGIQERDHAEFTTYNAALDLVVQVWADNRYNTGEPKAFAKFVAGVRLEMGRREAQLNRYLAREVLARYAPEIDAAMKMFFGEQGLDVSGIPVADAVVAGGWQFGAIGPPLSMAEVEAMPPHPLLPGVTGPMRAFSCRLFDEISRRTGSGANVFFSPVSIASVLQILLNGARGDTLSGMLEAMALRETMRTLPGTLASCAQLFGMLKSADPSGAKLSIANSVLVRPDVRLTPAFRETVERIFGGRLDALRTGMEPEINAWIAGQTADMITSLLDAGSIIPADAIMLINAIYFDGKWTNQFDPQITKPRYFKGVRGTNKVAMMCRRARFKYVKMGVGHERGHEAIILPYGNEKFGMVVVLPREGAVVREYMDVQDSIKDALAAESQDGFIALPRFKASQRVDLRDVLTALGMGTAFEDGRADFLGMVEDGTEPAGLFLSRVLHEAVVDVDEKGTCAAAATMVRMTRGWSPPGFEMVVDRPFYYSIMHLPTAMPLFMGVVNTL